MQFSLIFKTLRWQTFRLRTLMVVVVALALGLAAESERRRLAERRLLTLIADGRRSLVAVHESNARAHRKTVASHREWIKRYEDQKSDPRQLSWHGNGHEEFYLKQHLNEIRFLEERAAWEDAMASISAWAADHPREPWPAQPAEPGLASGPAVFIEAEAPEAQQARKRAAAYPFRPVAPGSPTVPTIVKKNQ